MGSGIGVLRLWSAAIIGAGASALAGAAEPVEIVGDVLPGQMLVETRITGEAPAAGWVRGCPGQVDAAAALTLALRGPLAPLRVHAVGEGVAGLVVVGPDGVHHCAAVDETGLAVVPFGRAIEGMYAVWPSVAVAGTPVPATLLLALRDLAPEEIAWARLGGAAALGRVAPPAQGPAPLPDDDPEAVLEFAVALAEATEGRVVVPGCAGAIDPARADAVAVLTLDAPEFHVWATANADTSLIVRDPAGGLHCADDTFGIHPAVRLDAAGAGAYAIWLGVFGGAPGEGATIGVGRVEPVLSDGAAGPEPDLAAGAPPAAGYLDAPADGVATLGFALAPASEALRPLASCPGLIDPTRPDAVVVLGQPAPVLSLRLRAAIDTTLVVRDPLGGLACADDVIGMDPALEFPDAAAGAYAVWAGVFPGPEAGEAVLEVRQVPLGDAAAGGDGLVRDAPPAAGVVGLAPDGVAALDLELNPVAPAIGPGCAGMIDPSRPDAVLRIAPGEGPAYLRARSAADATLLVVAPDGTLTCNDDALGSDPVVALEAPLPGDHAVWVGLFAPGGGASTATLEIARRPQDIGADPAALIDASPDAPVVNPFAGRPVASAAEALRIALEEGGLAEGLAYDRLEEEGATGVVLHGVVLSDPGGATPPLRIGRLRIADLDLAGLAATGEPTTFRIEASGIRYDDLAGGAGALGMPPIPAFAGTPMMAFTLALTAPGGDMTRREADLNLTLEGQFGIGVRARLRWPQGDAPFDPDAVLTEAIEAEIRDLGYLGALLATQAEAMGMSVEALKASVVEGLAEAVQPAPPGSRPAQLVDVVRAALAGSDRPGVVRLRLATDEPTGLEALLQGVADGTVEDGRLEFDLSYAPL